MLTNNELRRYSRQIRLQEVGIEGQEKLKNAKVLIIGAGGLGCPVLQYLAAAGIGTLGIVDNDLVDISNLQRQILFTTDDIEQPKVIVAKEKLLKMNPLLKVNAHFERLNKKNIFKIFEKYEIIVDCSDNFPTRYLINDACVITNKPLVYGAIERFEGQITVFNYKNGPTLRCLSPEQPGAFDVPTCAEVGVIGLIPGIIGAFQANEVIKIILEIGEILSGKILIFDALTYNLNLICLEKQKTSNITELTEYNDYCLSNEDEIKQITYNELIEKINKKDKITIIDVRYPEDLTPLTFKTIEIPIYNIQNSLNLIPKDSDVIFICDHSSKSIMAINYLQKKHSYKNLINLKDGLSIINI
ncbi:MAG: hypothetical protein A2046_14430 [Bacteroidetes bacterium GWA2_30_7]|nr:MAG: hypothetical protein A2046_14430 [Bacteroidetes bacterium GWA2_30_7]